MMGSNLLEYPIWYKDYLMMMVETQAHKKQKDESEVKDESIKNMDNHSIREFKVLQAF